MQTATAWGQEELLGAGGNAGLLDDSHFPFEKMEARRDVESLVQGPVAVKGWTHISNPDIHVPIQPPCPLDQNAGEEKCGHWNEL